MVGTPFVPTRFHKSRRAGAVKDAEGTAKRREPQATVLDGSEHRGRPGPCGQAGSVTMSRRDDRPLDGKPGDSRLFGGRCRAGWWRRRLGA